MSGAPAITLEQNFPNPFNPTTEINFGLVNSGKVSLRVYDALGREVAIVYDDLADDTLTLLVETDQLAPGVYLLRATTSTHTAVRPLTVLR